MPEEKEDRRFCKIDRFLSVAVGVEVSNTIEIPSATPGVVLVLPFPKRNSLKVYLDPGHHTIYPIPVFPDVINVKVPAILNMAEWGEIVLNRRPGARVIFGRIGELRYFPWDEEGKKEEEKKGRKKGEKKERQWYIPLRLYPGDKIPFNPVYVRVDHMAETYFFVIRAEWKGDTITINIDRNPAPASIPQFLT